MVCWQLCLCYAKIVRLQDFYLRLYERLNICIIDLNNEEITWDICKNVNTEQSMIEEQIQSRLIITLQNVLNKQQTLLTVTSYHAQHASTSENQNLYPRSGKCSLPVLFFFVTYVYTQ
jgi:hypothetical protein